MKRMSFFLLFVSSSFFSSAQRVDSVYRFVDSALNIMQHRSLFKENVKWKEVRDSTHRLAIEAATYGETVPALRYAFNKLGDKHGWLTINDSSYANPNFKNQTPISQTLKDVLKKGPVLYNGIIAKKYAYISIHFFGGQTLEGMNAFARQIQDSLCKNVTKNTKGIILDLRLNGGGNSFPMYQGISNVLGNGKFTESVNSLGQKEGEFVIRKGVITLPLNNGDTIKLFLEKTCGDLSKMPVAVLIGPVTGSSGEQVAIAFSSRKKSVLIGEPTAGYVTANNGFELPGINNEIVLAESLTRNLKGKTFIENVKPDIEVMGGDNFNNREQDAKIRAAVKWLDRQH